MPVEGLVGTVASSFFFWDFVIYIINLYLSLGLVGTVSSSEWSCCISSNGDGGALKNIGDGDRARLSCRN